MKVVILAGGLGTRISEESHLKPKPMIDIGDKPILWHIMKIYSAHGFNDFIICLGYKGYMIKEYFANYYLHESDVTYDFRKDNRKIIHNHFAEPWRVTLVDTGKDTQTGGRVKRVQPYVGRESFMLTYGDGVSDVDLKALEAFHRQHGKMATVTAVQPGGRFGALDMQGDQVLGFREKPQGDGNWINAGFFVLEPDIFDLIDADETIFEREPLQRAAEKGQFMAYKHQGFWQPMDTLREKEQLENLWRSGQAPWQNWQQE